MKKKIRVSPELLILACIVVACISFALYFWQHPISIDRIRVIQQQEKQETQQNGTRVSVITVVDGDTIDVIFSGKKERVRLIGVNAPEQYEGKNPECFAAEATAFVKAIISDKTIFLESDTSQDDRDKYGRLLRYVFLEDGTNLDLELIKQGYAREYTYKVPYRYQQVFREAQTTAKSANIGLWGKCK